MKCPYCGDEIPEYSNLDFHVQTEHGFSVPAQYTQDTIARAMKDPDFDKIESFEYTQKQLEDAKNWWQKAKLPHETEPWNELRIGARQKIIGRYADYMYKKHITGEGQRDLKPTGKNHGIDFYTNMALDDYMNNTYHTPDEYENALYGIDEESYSAEDTAMKRYGILRKLPNGEEIVDSAYGTELHAKDWWDSKTVNNEKGDGKSRKWDDLDSEERKAIRKLFNDDVREEYLGDEAFEDEKEFNRHVDGKPWKESTEYSLSAEESWKCNICGKEFGVAGHGGEGERFQHMMEHQRSGEEGLTDDIEEILNKLGINLDRDPEQVSNEESDEANPCWKGYKQIGMKDKDGKQVPNCVPANEGGFGSGRKGHSAWMRDMEFGGNYKVCPNCNVNTSFENNKCLICGN